MKISNLGLDGSDSVWKESFSIEQSPRSSGSYAPCNFKCRHTPPELRAARATISATRRTECEVHEVPLRHPDIAKSCERNSKSFVEP